MTGRLTLLAQRHPLAPPAAQRERLRELRVLKSFDDAVHVERGELRAGERVDVLQMNVGKVCNQTCAHCHVDAGPDRTEVMADDVVDACLRVVEREKIQTLDITGGAPELHPRFMDIVARGRAAGARVIDRCNLTALLSPAHRDLPAFFAAHDVHVIASLPFWEAERTDAQRGAGVFEKSIEALRALNAHGYGDDDVEAGGRARELSLVANPTGAFLPPPQAAFEADFRVRLAALGVRFTRLLVLTNMPIARTLEWLDRTGNTQRYLDKLTAAFNPAAVAGLMCRSTVSVGFDGRLYDCDFNQMLEIGTTTGLTISSWESARLAGRRIATDVHCFGCTAGQGSSCTGALA